VLHFLFKNSEHVSMQNAFFFFAGKLEKTHASCLSSVGEIEVRGLMVMKMS